MPAPQTVCVHCTQCKWKALREEGDVVLPGSLRLLSTCPSCGGRLAQVQASLADRVNPLTRLRGLGSIFRRGS